MVQARAYTRNMRSPAFRIREGTNPRTYARRIRELVAKGDTVLGVAYAPGVDGVLEAIDALVLAELPEARSTHLHWHDGERTWLWSLGEPKGVAFLPRRESENLDVEIELQGALPRPAERFPQQEFGWRVFVRDEPDGGGPDTLVTPSHRDST